MKRSIRGGPSVGSSSVLPHNPLYYRPTLSCHICLSEVPISLCAKSKCFLLISFIGVMPLILMAVCKAEFYPNGMSNSRGLHWNVFGKFIRRGSRMNKQSVAVPCQDLLACLSFSFERPVYTPASHRRGNIVKCLLLPLLCNESLLLSVRFNTTTTSSEITVQHNGLHSTSSSTCLSPSTSQSLHSFHCMPDILKSSLSPARNYWSPMRTSRRHVRMLLIVMILKFPGNQSRQPTLHLSVQSLPLLSLPRGRRGPI